MFVSESFCSIDGEGVRAGQKAVFIRFAGCNIRCEYCFGVKPGRHIPYVRTSYRRTSGDHKKHITDVQVGDWLMTYDADLNLVETEVKSVHKHDVTKWYELQIGDHMFFVTPEHPMFTVSGLKSVAELEVGDIILDCKPEAYNSYAKQVNNPMWNADVAAKSAQNTDYSSVGQKVSDSISLKKSVGEYQSSWESMSDSQKLAYRQKQSAAKMGAKNSHYNPDAHHAPNYDSLRAKIASGEITECEITHASVLSDPNVRLCVHHIDGDHNNDDINNLVVITMKLHNQIHRRGYNFWLGPRKDKKQLKKVVAANGKQVQSKKLIDITKHPHFGKAYGPKPLTVYNLSCAPYNSYLISDMWVHNCDTKYSLAESQANAAYTCAADVAEAVTKFCVEGVVNNITITGGEPLLYPDDICDILDQLDQTQFAFSINIETNGTISPVEFIEKYKRTNFAHCLLNDLFFTFDIKTHSAGEAARAACMQGDSLLPVIASYTPYMNTFTRKYNDVIKAVVGSREDLDYIRKIYTSWITRPHEYQWYISPVFGKIEPCDLVEYVLTHNDCAAWRVQLQMHKIIWDVNKRGV